MDEAKLRGLMGLCVRARQAVFGEDGCLKTIRSGGCGMMLVDGGASRSTMEKYENACRNNHVPLGILPEGLLHDATGRPGVGMAVSQGGLSKQIAMLLGVEASGAQQMKSANNCGGASVE